MILFRDAVAMVDQSPALAQRINKSGGAGKSGTLRFFRPAHFSGLSVRMMGSQGHAHTVL
jgi:hypothetical protein